MDASIGKRASFEFIRYSNLWEDADILCEALEPSSGKRILSIASAGDNAFALMAEGAFVVAADLNPSQLACVELKREIFRRFDYDDILSFFGIRAGDQRIEMYNSICESLTKPTRTFWDSNETLIKYGVIDAGKFERFFQLFHNRILPLIHRKKIIKELFIPRSREDRIKYYDSTWNTFRWRLFFRLFFSRFVVGRLGRDPEFFRYVEGSVADRFLERTKYAL